MATIRLNNLTKPRNINSPKTTPTVEIFVDKPIYTDLHLDLQLEKNVGYGDDPKNSGDIKVDNDIEDIKNSIRNIFNTRKGQKILSPGFGSSLDQFLFERVDDFVGNIIGETILNNLQTFEPRIEVLKINVYPFPDQNQYNIQVFYKFLQINKNQVITLSVMNDGQIIL